LKRAGYDILVIQGRANNQVYLSIGISGWEIRDARALWGKTTREMIRTLQKSATKERARVACIGPAGENLSLISAIMNDAGRAAARGGVGAVMGSKQLKAVVIIDPGERGSESPPYSDTIHDIRKRLQESGMTSGGLHMHGTAALMHLVHSIGVLPSRNYQANVFEGIEEVSGEKLTAKYLKSRSACYSCPVACGRVCTIDGQAVDGPEYETMWAFGPECGVKDLSFVIRANHLCNELGLDTISTGVTIACAMELTQRGYCQEIISFGDGKSVCDLVKKNRLQGGDRR
jgi:aldehyde:ferredoxin oxidoreductase